VMPFFGEGREALGWAEKGHGPQRHRGGEEAKGTRSSKVRVVMVWRSLTRMADLIRNVSLTFSSLLQRLSPAAGQPVRQKCFTFRTIPDRSESCFLSPVVQRLITPAELDWWLPQQSQLFRGWKEAAALRLGRLLVSGRHSSSAAAFEAPSFRRRGVRCGEGFNPPVRGLGGFCWLHQIGSGSIASNRSKPPQASTGAASSAAWAQLTPAFQQG